MAPRAGGLSNGTLSLKFMQRAQISANESPVEAARAKLVNDSEWELPAARAGQSKASSGRQSMYGYSFSDVVEMVEPSSASVTYEASYLPFLFDRATQVEEGQLDEDEDTPPPGRRRLFVNGKEKITRDVETPIQHMEPEPVSWTCSLVLLPDRSSCYSCIPLIFELVTFIAGSVAPTDDLSIRSTSKIDISQRAA